MPSSTPSPIDAFKRFARGQRSTPPQPEPPFPAIPEEIKAKFEDLRPFWDRYEKEIANWLKQRQTV